MTELINTYLQDHHAGSAAGLDAFRRVAEGHSESDVREAVRRIGEQAASDQKSLEEVMQRFGAEPALLKDLSTKLGEKVARLKPNQHVSSRSPLSDLLEVEALVDAVHAKSLLWVVLRQLDDERVDKEQMESLLERARSQEEELKALLVGQAPKLLKE